MGKIGIIGSGVVGKKLAEGFSSKGYKVKIGTRDESKLMDFLINKENISLGNFQEAADFSDIIVLAVKGSAAIDVLNIIGKEKLNGKIIIDTTNPISDEKPENGVLRFFTSLDKSLMEELQLKFPEAKFVKAFNSIGNDLMVNPKFSGVKPSMFICGNDNDSKIRVSKILDLFGFEVEDMGKVEAARAIEPLCILWCIPGFLKNDWNHAFKLLKSKV